MISYITKMTCKIILIIHRFQDPMENTLLEVLLIFAMNPFLKKNMCLRQKFHSSLNLIFFKSILVSF